MLRIRPISFLSAWLAAWLVLAPAVATPPTTRPVEGLRENTPAIYALTGARIVVAPGQLIEQGTVVVRDDVIESVGADARPPADARAIDCTGKTIYAGLIDAYSETSVGDDESKTGSPHWNPYVVPQRGMAARYRADQALNKKLRSQGIAVRLAAPEGGILKGTSALVTTGEEANDQAIVKADVAQHFRLTVSRGNRDQYPNSPMGAVALARQTMLDAQWYRDAWRAWRANSHLPRPETNDALEALRSLTDGSGLVIFDAGTELFSLRADQFAREFGLNAVVRGSGREYRRLDDLQKTGRPVIVPVSFPKAPNVATPESARNATLQELMHWDLAPENPGRLRAAGVRIALCTHGLPDKATFLKSVGKAIQRGLSADDALRAVTVAPAELYGMADRLGTVEGGKLANLVVTDGDLFGEKTNVLETWVLGRRFELKDDTLFDLRGDWPLKLTPQPDGVPDLVVRLKGEPTKLTGTIERVQPGDEDKPVALKQIGVRDARFSAVFESKSFGREGMAQLSVVVSKSDEGKLSWFGQIVWPDGTSSVVTAARAEEEKAAEPEESPDDQPADEATAGDTAPTPVVFPFGAFGYEQVPQRPRHLLFQNATIWTCGPEGVLENASLLIEDGKIVELGLNLTPPEDAVIVDAGGKHLTPGIIDCHSHMASDGGINESAQAITAQVRIGDFIDSQDINIYRQLAGGVTGANILHGSANPIGGQNQVIKLRWGASPEAMKFAEAPAGIKFALGENVKQSNWGDRYTTRYPQTRMGVEQLIEDAFHAARDYESQGRRWQQSREGLPPRRDLQLDALVEILNGQRWIHCHSYRQDEILALLRTLEEFDIQIGTLQHILEGYKVADAMARHGAMASSFSDWWAYKLEVIDAIPHNGALMHNAGIVVSFNSDDQELARHLNHEAAKAVKYGGVPPEEALKFVTLNPAKQLRIDAHVGSLEPGKHADLVVWSGPPLSTFSRCEQTWIDGRKYFDIELDKQHRTRDRELRQRLVQKILRSGDAMLAPGERDASEDELWPRHDIFCHHEHDDHH